MKTVIQRVLAASVVIDGAVFGSIGQGILVLLGVEKGDCEADAEWLSEKIATLRIFSDAAGKMNLSMTDVNGSMLVVSQFTLAGNCTKGKRPSFDTAAPADVGKKLYEHFVRSAEKLGISVQTGIFQSDMKVSLVNDGPVTFILERRGKKP